MAKRISDKNSKKASKNLDDGRHHTFRRSYREDYVRELEVPGMMHHILQSFKILFSNWKLFLPFLIMMVVMTVLFVGLMSEGTYIELQKVIDRTSEETGANIGTAAKAGILLITTAFTGGVTTSSTTSNGVFIILGFLIIWLVTIFLLRQKLASNDIKLRDGLYNAMTPLLSTFVVLMVAMIQMIPIILLIVAYSAAIETNFLATPFYAMIFLVFAGLMILLTGYLWSGTLMALVAVTAPGLYPLEAIRTANELMRGRRIKFILRLIALIITLIVLWAIIMIPIILIDLFMKQANFLSGVPFVPVCLVTMTCFSGMYVATYLYLYYRYMLSFDTKEH